MNNKLFILISVATVLVFGAGMFTDSQCNKAKTVTTTTATPETLRVPTIQTVYTPVFKMVSKTRIEVRSDTVDRTDYALIDRLLFSMDSLLGVTYGLEDLVAGFDTTADGAHIRGEFSFAERAIRNLSITRIDYDTTKTVIQPATTNLWDYATKYGGWAVAILVTYLGLTR